MIIHEINKSFTVNILTDDTLYMQKAELIADKSRRQFRQSDMNDAAPDLAEMLRKMEYIMRMTASPDSNGSGA